MVVPVAVVVAEREPAAGAGVAGDEVKVYEAPVWIEHNAIDRRDEEWGQDARRVVVVDPIAAGRGAVRCTDGVLDHEVIAGVVHAVDDPPVNEVEPRRVTSRACG